MDEAINLAAAFQLAGYRHVIGTLWPIGDDDVTVGIAEAFYAGLGPARDAGAIDAGAIDTGRAALSLHHVMRAVRDAYPSTPTLWAAHIHTGA